MQPDFVQSAPVAGNRFVNDRSFRLALERLLPPEIFAEASPHLRRMGERAGHEMPPLADRAERNVPRHVPISPWGARMDQIEVDPSFERLVAIGQEEGLVALPYENPYGAYSRIVQAGLLNLFDPMSAVASCPLAMSDGAAWLLRRHDPTLAAKYVPRLTARTGGWTSGQWMTEKEGGSDVSRTSTRAEAQPDGTFKLFGTKYFTSATSADIALALARPDGAAPGSSGLSLFLLELRTPDGSWNGIEVRRLKDKMGTKALPTAELSLNGTIATAVGGLGRGVAKIASLLNIARLWAASAGPAGVGHLLSLARDYAVKRHVFGRPLTAQPMHAAWMAGITAEYESMVALCFETAAAIGRAEHGGNGGLARLLAPLNKLACARQGIEGTSQLLESFGGAGYMEDTGIPRVFRNTHVHAIWEGTTSVLAHDVLRALGNRDLGQEWIEDVDRRLAGVTVIGLDAVVARTQAALSTIRAQVLEPLESEGRRLAGGMARITQAALLAEAAEWRARRKDDKSGLVAAELFTRTPLLAPETADLALADLAFSRAEIVS